MKTPKAMNKGGSPGPINNSDVLLEENTKVSQSNLVVIAGLFSLCCGIALSSAKNLY